MANINRIVRINIALRTAAAQQQTFSDILLVGPTTMPERVRIITDSDQLITDSTFGLTSSSPMYRAAQVAFSQIPSPSRVFIGRRNANEEVDVAMAAIRAANDDWYGVIDTTHSETATVDFAEWTEANKKLFATVMATGNYAAGGLAEQLETNQFFRTAWWHVANRATDFPEVATLVRGFSTLPGGETYANLRLQGVPFTAITETVYNQVTAFNGNTFEPFRNVAITQNGKVAAGEWIDIIRFRDWLEEEMSTRIFNQLLDNRIPYTDQGIQIIVQRMREALDLGIRRGGIAPEEVSSDGQSTVPSYKITYPRSSQISVSDKASRILRDVGFTARLAGAIHAVEVNGALTYDTSAVQ